MAKSEAQKQYHTEYMRRRRSTPEGKAENAAYRKQWRESQRGIEMASLPENRQREAERAQTTRDKYPERNRARMDLRNAIRRGDVVRQPCQTPGCSRKAQAHHNDYSKPLEVEWYCQPCHMAAFHSKTADISDSPEEAFKLAFLPENNIKESA